MFASVLIAYLPRTALAPAVSLIQKDLAISDVAMGQILGIWAIGYMTFQLPGGWLGTRLGRRLMLPAYGIAWSACTLVTSAASSFTALWWSRLLFGTSQAGLVPCLTRACVDWIPLDRRGIASAAITAGMSLGGVAATGLSALLLPHLGWRLTLQLFALLGVAWAAAFWFIFRDQPRDHPWVNQAELDRIKEPLVDPRVRDQIEPQPSNSTPTTRPFAVYKSLAFAMLLAEGFCRTYAYNFLNTWFPTYIERVFSLPVATAAAYAMFPLAAYATGSVLGGVLIDTILRKTGSKWLSRSASGAAALILAGIACASALLATNHITALVLISLSSACAGISAPATWAATMDIGGPASASLMAFGNMVGNLGAYLCPAAIGLMLKLNPNGWSSILLMIAIVLMIGGICWLFLNPEPKKHPA
jgi:MFS family permease